MGKTASNRLRLGDDVATLGRALGARERAELAKGLGQLLAWQRTLRVFPRLRAPDATPYVSLYASGALRGCYGSHEGAPGERLARAFLRALTDTRYGGISSENRHDLAADVAYIARARPCRADEAIARIEPGAHGIALAAPEGTTVLLPSVARERGYDAAGFVDLLWKKTGRAPQREGLVWILDVEEVSSRRASASDARAAARRHLESLVDRDGRVAFEIDPGTGEARHAGVMRHGRIAVAVEALAALGSPKARGARAWLAAEIARGVARGVDGWPDRPDAILGTLALAARAGVEAPLEELADRIDVGACSSWHAAQAASVLGARTPERLWQLCVSSLEQRPFSPFTLMAARARADGAVIERCARAIIDSIAHPAPFSGGARVTAVPGDGAHGRRGRVARAPPQRRRAPRRAPRARVSPRKASARRARRAPPAHARRVPRVADRPRVQVRHHRPRRARPPGLTISNEIVIRTRIVLSGG